MKVGIEIRHGVPCMRESFGVIDSKGIATMVADKQGNRVEALLRKDFTELSTHLVKVRKGYFIIKSSYIPFSNGPPIQCLVYVIKKLNLEDKTALLEKYNGKLFSKLKDTIATCDYTAMAMWDRHNDWYERIISEAEERKVQENKTIKEEKMSKERFINIKIDLNRVKWDENDKSATINELLPGIINDALIMEDVTKASATYIIRQDATPVGHFKIDPAPKPTFTITVDGGSFNKYSVEASSIREALDNFRKGGLYLNYKIADEDGKIVDSGEFDLADVI